MYSLSLTFMFIVIGAEPTFFRWMAMMTGSYLSPVYREALSIARGLDEEKVKRIIGVIFHNLGLVYLRGESLSAAEENFKKAIDAT